MNKNQNMETEKANAFLRLVMELPVPLAGIATACVGELWPISIGVATDPAIDPKTAEIALRQIGIVTDSVMHGFKFAHASQTLKALGRSLRCNEHGKMLLALPGAKCMASPIHFTPTMRCRGVFVPFSALSGVGPEPDPEQDAVTVDEIKSAVLELRTNIFRDLGKIERLLLKL